MSENRFNTIVIIDSIPSGELNTARKLLEDLEIIACAFADGLKIEYLRVDTITDVEAGMSKVLQNLKNNGLFPLFHLEGHGLDTEDGFALPDGSFCSWSQFNKFITPVNVAMGLNLMLVMATCYGGSFVKSVMTTDRAPLWGLIGPIRELTAGQIQTDFVKFYRMFFEKTSGDAINTLVGESFEKLYYLESAQNWFYAVWKSYKNNECTKDKIEQRAREMYRKAKADRIARIPSVGQLKRKIRSKEKEYFDRYRDTYFMYDLHPSNRDRFPVTYEKAESLRMRNSNKK